MQTAQYKKSVHPFSEKRNGSLSRTRAQQLTPVAQALYEPILNILRSKQYECCPLDEVMEQFSMALSEPIMEVLNSLVAKKICRLEFEFADLWITLGKPCNCEITWIPSPGSIASNQGVKPKGFGAGA